MIKTWDSSMANKQRVAAAKRAAAKKRKAARERAKPSEQRALEAHEYKTKQATAKIAHYERIRRKAETFLTKWKRKLRALEASTHRVGKPRNYKPKPLTQAELDALDATFID